MAPGPSASATAGGLLLWLHGSGETGEESRARVGPYFSAPELAAVLRLSFPTAPIACYGDEVITAWFGITEVPITANTVRDEKEVLTAVAHVHEMLNKEVAAGTSPANIFVSGLSQGGALALASVLLYPKMLGGGAVFSGWVPFGSSVVDRISAEARKTPILWSHGMADTIVLFKAGQAGLSFLQSLGFSCEFKAYPGLAHSIANEEYNSLEAWIKSRLKHSQDKEN